MKAKKMIFPMDAFLLASILLVRAPVISNTPLSRFLWLMTFFIIGSVATGGHFRGSYYDHIPTRNMMTMKASMTGDTKLDEVFDIAPKLSGVVDGLQHMEDSRGAIMHRRLNPKEAKGTKKGFKKNHATKNHGKKTSKKGSSSGFVDVIPGVTQPQETVFSQPISTPPPSPTPASASDVCPVGDVDCIMLFAEDYEEPLYDFSDASLVFAGSTLPGDDCIKAEGEPNALYNVRKGTSDMSQTINLAYGKRDNLYDEDSLKSMTYGYAAAVVYLQTFKLSDSGKSLTLSDGRGGKYAIQMDRVPGTSLRLSFNTQGRKFVAFGMDIAPFFGACPSWQIVGHYPSSPPQIHVSAIERSSNQTLGSVSLTGTGGVQEDRMSVVWSHICGTLDVAQALDGKIFFDWYVSEASSALLMDNVKIIASNDQNKRPLGC